MKSEAKLDRFGRVVIPKATRSRFGLSPGSTLTVVETATGIVLSPVAAEPLLRREQGVLVFSGRIAGDLEQTLARVRQERSESLGLDSSR